MRKERFFGFLFLLFLVCIIFILGEITIRLVMGKRLLIQEVQGAGFYLLRPNQRGWYYPHVPQQATINNVGARGVDINLELLSKRKKYIFFGDSFVFGWGILDEETLPYFFQKFGGFGNEEVLNYGNNAFGPRHMIGTYNFYTTWFDPGDTIIMVLIKDDLSRTRPLYKGSPLKDFFWKVKGQSAFVAWTWSASRYGLELVAQMLKSPAAAVSSPVDEEPLKGPVGTLLLDFNRELEKKNQNFVLVFFEYTPTHYSREAKDFCVRHGLRCITNVYDFVSPLKEMNKKIYTFDNMHPSAETNAVVAQGVLKFLKGKK